jgi:hypothetical protein
MQIAVQFEREVFGIMTCVVMPYTLCIEATESVIQIP